MKAWISRRLPFANTAEERLKRPIQPSQHILQDLGVNVAIFGPHFFNVWQLGALNCRGDAHPAFLPCLPSLLKRSIIQFAAATQDKLHRPLLLWRGSEFVLEGLAHLLLVHMSLFCPLATKSVRRAGHSFPG